jgi:hypothetical protein
MRNTISIITFAILVGFFLGCKKEGPVDLWKEKPSGDPTPQITGITPANRATAGVLDITINGINFSPTAADNFVYFGSAQTEVTSATATQLTVLRPNIFGDSITFRVVARGAAEIANNSGYYAVDQVTGSIGTFLSADKLTTIATDTSGNVYIVCSNDRTIRKMSPDGQMTNNFATYTGFVAPSDIHVGPDGFVYVKLLNNTGVTGIANTGGPCATVFSFSQRLSYFDFDQNHNVYAGGAKNSLFRIDAPASKTSTSIAVADYKIYNILSVRVFNNYVYVFADTTGTGGGGVMGIYKHQITSSAPNGVDSTKVLVLAWSATGDYATSTFKDLTFAADGTMYIATNKSTDPILMVSPTGEQRSLYKGILSSTAEELAWTGSKLYQRLGGSKNGLMWIATGKPGAPYYGR